VAVILYFILLLCLSGLLIQDWKYRKIHVGLPVIVFLLSFFLVQRLHRLDIKIVLHNILFFIVMLSVLVLYMSIRNKRFLNPFENYFGLGDLLFYIAVTPLFFLYNYIMYIILSMIFALVMQLFLRRLIRKDMIPLAGFSAFFLMIIILKDCFLDFTKVTLI
jgi:hypothetical protein